jgi:uncharacterized membrane protein (UPF0127 family)
LVVALGSCFAVGADRPRKAYVLPANALPGHSAATSRVAGFGQIGFRVVSPSGTAGPDKCALLADNSTNRAQGMMGRRDLAGYAGMVFRWGADTSDSFFNKGVPIALSIAWFDGAGVYVGAADLAVCSASCPTVTPAEEYQYALEVPKGGLGGLGIGQGSVLQLGGHC